MNDTPDTTPTAQAAGSKLQTTMKIIALALCASLIARVEWVRFREGKEWTRSSRRLDEVSAEYWGRTPKPPMPDDWSTSGVMLLVPESIFVTVRGLTNCSTEINGAFAGMRRLTIWPPLEPKPSTNIIRVEIELSAKPWDGWYLSPEDLEPQRAYGLVFDSNGIKGTAQHQ
jgi:hypothetical protein